MKDTRVMQGLSAESESLYDEKSASGIGVDASKVAAAFQQKKIERLNEEIEDLKQDRSQRKIFSYCIFGFMCAYMAASIVIIFLCGFEVMHLDNSILVTLLTTTLANVIGVFNFVAKYLFHNKEV